ncbi:MAG TPA: hypothetical protein VF240_22180 [Pyrinomonadaceae bacterium]
MRFTSVKIYLFVCALSASLVAAACQQAGDAVSVRPKTLRDVPAVRLAFRFEADVAAENLPEQLKGDGAPEKNEAVARDFETRRPEEELLRTVTSPDGQRALALYATSETTGLDFRMDLYSSEGVFLRNIMPPNMVGSFYEEVAWSSDGQHFAFLGFRNPTPAATPDPGRETTAPPSVAVPDASPGDPAAEAPPVAVPTVAPIIAPVAAFGTEQVYLSDRDGLNIRPLTTRDGLIYFELAWSPDAQLLAALACTEAEWNARKGKGEAPGGRPRLIALDAQERLLDDRLADAAPVWSPDASKVATAFDKTVAVYDAAGGEPTGANLPLQEALWASSVEFDAKMFKKGGAAANTDAGQQGPEGGGSSSSDSAAGGAVPPVGSVVLNSFNPVVRVAWTEPELLFVQTAYMRYFPNEPVPTVRYERWHVVKLYPQATLVSRLPRRPPSGARRPHVAS